MGDMGETFREYNAYKRERRQRLGHDCDRHEWERVRALWKGEMK